MTRVLFVGQMEAIGRCGVPRRRRPLAEKGWPAVGAEKSSWAEKITPHTNVYDNKSPSFICFRDSLRR
jgi:hypothetical protein